MQDILKQGKIILATHNSGKVKELQYVLDDLNITVQSSAQLGLDDPEETGKSFAENALLKARSAYNQCQIPSLADDSGLSVWALDGAPGIYSGRWAEVKDAQSGEITRDFAHAMDRLIDLLAEKEDKSASFCCALAFVYGPNDNDVIMFEGRVDGVIVAAPRIDSTLGGGFGYDPIFESVDIPGKTFGEISSAEKNAISHRGRAVKKFMDYIT